MIKKEKIRRKKYCIFPEIQVFNPGINKEFPFEELEFSEKCLEIHLNQQNNTGSRRKDLIQYQLYNILQKITIPKNLSVLDIGCGPGLYYEGLNNFLHNEFEYVGIDKGPALINYALKTYNVINATFILNDIFHFNFKQKKFNLILMMYDFYNFFSKKKMNELIAKTAKILGDDGYLIMEVKLKSEFSNYDFNFFYRESGLFSNNNYIEIIEQGVIKNRYYGHRHFIYEIENQKVTEYYNFLNIVTIEEIEIVLNINNLKTINIFPMDKYRKLLIIGGK